MPVRRLSAVDDGDGLLGFRRGVYDVAGNQQALVEQL